MHALAGIGVFSEFLARAMKALPKEDPLLTADLAGPFMFQLSRAPFWCDSADVVCKWTKIKINLFGP